MLKYIKALILLIHLLSPHLVVSSELYVNELIFEATDKTLQSPLAEGGAQERLPSKEEIDRLFSLTKAQWEAMASDFFLPGYKVRYAKHKTGFQVIGYEVSTGFTFSIQPLYGNDTDPPVMVVIGNYFPAGRLPTMTEKLKSDTEAVARQALGASYDVKLTYRQMGNIEALEFTLSKAERP